MGLEVRLQLRQYRVQLLLEEGDTILANFRGATYAVMEYDRGGGQESAEVHVGRYRYGFPRLGLGGRNLSRRVPTDAAESPHGRGCTFRPEGF